MTVLWVYVQAVHVSAAQIRQEGGGKTAPVKHGAGPKATEVAQLQHPWALWRRRKEQDRAEKNRASIQTFFFFSSLKHKGLEKIE